MKVKLLVATPENMIGESGKICYGTKQLEDGGKDITSSLVHGHGHLAVLRFAFVVVEVEDISVACQNQFVRSKHLDFLVQSKRYVDPSKGDFKFIMPENLTEEQEDYMRSMWEKSIFTYKILLKQGVKKEDARAILPANTSTKLRAAGSLQAWYDFFKLRLTPHAQKEIRDVAKSIYMQLTLQFPQVFTEELYNKFTSGKDNA